MAGSSRRRFLKHMARVSGVVGFGGASLFDWAVRTALGEDCGPPPPAKPHRRKAGESFPPLPLPATPLRRTERKRQPAPPALIGKVTYGEPVTKVGPDGQKYTYQDWYTDPGDSTVLMNWANRKLGVHYRSIDIGLKNFSFNPEQIPILYFSGHNPFEWSDDLASRLRRFVYDGGTIFADDCCGLGKFADSFRRNIRKVFPDRPLYEIEMDHPLYEAFYKIEKVKYQLEGKGRFEDRPPLQGINIGCRLAVMFTPVDMSCGWDGHLHDRGHRVMPEDARKLGANMVTYAIANYQLGRFLSTERVYHQAGKRARDEFVFGQVMHDGDWDPDPSAAANLLKVLGKETSVNVQFKRADVRLDKVNAFDYPMLYMTGQRDFTWNDTEVKTLRAYLAGGGVLLADACCGRATFDAAFRRELAKVVGKDALKPVPMEHPLYAVRYKVRSAEYSELLKQKAPKLNTPTLEGVAFDGRMRVIYSKYDIGCGWEEFEHPYARAYAPEDALRLGVNAVIYAMVG